MIMDDKAGRRVGGVQARHFKAIIDALESAAGAHEVGSQNAVFIAMCHGVNCAIDSKGREKGLKVIREMLDYAEEIVTASYDEYLQSKVKRN
jgi:hypothetical protein